MRFWDSSALVPLLLDQPSSARALELLAIDSEMIVWWGSPIECWSALHRLERERTLTAEDVDEAAARLSTLSSSWHEVAPVEEVRLQARRLLRRHSLRAADSMQLAAALVWAGLGEERELVTFDERLKVAARLEGFVT
ncbi:MAG: type II toxin-antitoxin system VapC family toxin [Longimicrobiales bacterium]